MVDFKCGIHFTDADKQVSFSTPSYEEWQKHVAEFDHEHVGFVDCKDCGTKNIPQKITLKVQPRIVAPAYCDDCKNRLRKILLEEDKHE